MSLCYYIKRDDLKFSHNLGGNIYFLLPIVKEGDDLWTFKHQTGLFIQEFGTGNEYFFKRSDALNEIMFKASQGAVKKNPKLANVILLHPKLGQSKLVHMK